MTTKFLVYENSILYSTHGEIAAKLIYNAFLKEGLADNFLIAGFCDGKEELTKIKSIEECHLNKCFNAEVSGEGIQNNNTLLYPEQRLINDKDEIVTVKAINANTLVVSLNGMLNVNYTMLNKKNSDIIEFPVNFYMIECEKDMSNIYVDTIVFLPYLEGDKKPSFFTKAKK
jgi:hypothetical protein